jgi:hypothetical protein
MMTRTPYTTNFISSTFNQTIDYKNFLNKCQMGVNLKVVKLESSIIRTHATSMLITQH